MTGSGRQYFADLGPVSCRVSGREIEVEVAAPGVRVSRVAVIRFTDPAAAARAFEDLGRAEIRALAAIALDGEPAS